MRSIIGVLFAVVASASMAAGPGANVVKAVQAIVESGGVITNQAALTSAAGPEVGAYFASARKIVTALQAKGTFNVTNWEALEGKAANMSADQVVAALGNLSSANQASMMAALSAPAKRVNIAPVAQAITGSFVCPTGADKSCQELVSKLELARGGKSDLTARQAEEIMSTYASLVGEARELSCVSKTNCFTQFTGALARILSVYGTVSKEFMLSMIRKTGEFAGFQTMDAIVKGLENASRLGRAMGAQLEGCILNNAAPAAAN